MVEVKSKGAEQKSRTPDRGQMIHLKSIAIWSGGVLLAAIVWAGLYRQILPFSIWAGAFLAPLCGPRVGAAAQAFTTGALNALLLVGLVVFVMGLVRSFCLPQWTKALSFLRTPSGVNEVGVGLFWALAGGKAAAVYLTFGVGVAYVSRHVDVRLQGANKAETKKTIPDRIFFAYNRVCSVIGSGWPWMVLGIAIGAGIQSFVPDGAAAQVLGRSIWWAVPVAVVVGAPISLPVMVALPVVAGLVAKGASLGTGLAFVIALSASWEAVLKQRLSAAASIVLGGLVVNALLG